MLTGILFTIQPILAKKGYCNNLQQTSFYKSTNLSHLVFLFKYKNQNSQYGESD